MAEMAEPESAACCWGKLLCLLCLSGMEWGRTLAKGRLKWIQQFPSGSSGRCRLYCFPPSRFTTLLTRSPASLVYAGPPKNDDCRKAGIQTAWAAACLLEIHLKSSRLWPETETFQAQLWEQSFSAEEALGFQDCWIQFCSWNESMSRSFWGPFTVHWLLVGSVLCSAVALRSTVTWWLWIPFPGAG